MGLLRLTLAISVVVAHLTNGRANVFVGGPPAVEVFFLVSGFYMAMILTEKYVGRDRYKLFITNRGLRLFPAYWVVLLAACLGWAAIGAGTGNFGPLSLFAAGFKPLAMFLLIAVRVGIVGQEGLLFLRGTPGGDLAVTRDFWRGPPPYLWGYQVVPPAWSLSLEVTFYLLAPFIVGLRSAWLWTIMAASFGLRLLAYHRGLDHDPWTYRFFPFEILFFVGGMVAYRNLRRVRLARPSATIVWSVTAVALLVLAVYPIVPDGRRVGGFEPKLWVEFAVAWASLPYLFLWSNPSAAALRTLKGIDRWAGEFSFPLYIVHYPLMMMAHVLARGRVSPAVLATEIGLASVVGSAVLIRFVMSPVERLRTGRVDRARRSAVNDAVNIVNP